MADDEVPSLVEMGLVDIPPSTFSVPADQVGRLARTNPVWYKSQRFLIDRLPANEVSYRIPSVAFALVTSVLTFLVAARTRGLWFAVALFLVLHGSQPFVFLAQLNRFYSLPLLLLVATLGAIWWPRQGPIPMLVTGLLATLAVLSHNMTMVVLVLGCLAAGPTTVLGWTPRYVLWRSGAAAGIGLGLYVGYIRPIIAGWNSTGNPTPVLISFAAHAGIAALALAALGGWFALVRRDESRAFVWWMLLFAGGFCVFQLTSINWNPRYFVFFMPGMWMLAALAVDAIGRSLGRGLTGAAWYGCVALLFAPGLLSHFQDGSRHDYREAARVVVDTARDGQAIVSDDAETISYYLPAAYRERLLVRTKVTQVPPGEFFLVARSNAWMAQPQVPGRQLSVLAEISRRRFDQFSHVLRVYRVAPATQQLAP